MNAFHYVPNEQVSVSGQMDPLTGPLTNLKNLKNLISTIRSGRAYTIKGKEGRRGGPGASRERIKLLVKEVLVFLLLGSCRQ